MSPEEAKILLSARRPSGGDDASPEMAEALAAAAQNSELARWLAEEQAFDAAISAKLHGHAVPGDLRDRILAGMRGSQPENPDARAEAEDQGSGPKGKISRHFFLWGTGAAAALAGGLFLGMKRNLPEIARFRTDMLDFYEHRFGAKFDYADPDPARVMAWLKAHPLPAKFEPPGNLAQGTTLGCRVIPWSGTDVTLVCFMPPGSPQPIHVFAVTSGALAEPATPGREFVRQGDWNTAVWTHNGNTLMAISQLPVEAMTRHLNA